jgi:hypothetical protein
LVYADLTGAILTGANLDEAIQDGPSDGLTLDLPDPNLLG